MSEKRDDDHPRSAPATTTESRPARRAGDRPLPPDQTGELPVVRTDSATGEMWILL